MSTESRQSATVQGVLTAAITSSTALLRSVKLLVSVSVLVASDSFALVLNHVLITQAILKSYLK